MISVSTALALLLCAGLGFLAGRSTTPSCCDGSGSNTYPIHTALVTAIVDGDTIQVEGREVVRYIGIDTPGSDQCYGPEAKDMNRQLVEGKTVILIGDVEERDRYGRLLFYVIADGRFVNAELVRLGYARAESYGDSVMFQQVLTVFERYAYQSGAGLWGACEHE